MMLRTFVADEYLPYAERHLKASSVAATKALLHRCALPALPDQIEVIIKADILNLHKRLARTPVQANRAVVAVSAVMRLALDYGVITVNPCHGVKLYRERKRERFLSPDEQKLLRGALTQTPVDLLIGLLLATGARPGELIKAQWEWVNAQQTALRLPDAKRGARTIFLSETARKLLVQLPAPHTGALFKKWIDLQRGWKRLVKRAGIEWARPYDLRHTFASNALRNGHNLSAIGLTLGHSNAQTTMRYAHLCAEQGLAVAAAANGEGK